MTLMYFFSLSENDSCLPLALFRPLRPTISDFDSPVLWCLAFYSFCRQSSISQSSSYFSRLFDYEIILRLSSCDPAALLSTCGLYPPQFCSTRSYLGLNSEKQKAAGSVTKDDLLVLFLQETNNWPVLSFLKYSWWNRKLIYNESPHPQETYRLEITDRCFLTWTWRKMLLKHWLKLGNPFLMLVFGTRDHRWRN